MSRVYKRVYHDRRTGRTKKLSRWWVAFHDHRKVERRLPGPPCAFERRSRRRRKQLI